MQAMVLETARAPLRMRERPTPVPPAREILLEVAACGVCRTDLHVVDGELPRADAREFLDIVPLAGVKTEVTRYPLAAANDALADLREGRLQGAAVLLP
jgi:D-arabinose 1-dehydrogenase-like Zn-dependent alcohol dehydrogenase